LTGPTINSAEASVEETKWLTYCVGLTDTAWSVANRKIAGEKREQVEAYYAGLPDKDFGVAPRKLVGATIDKVYGEGFSHTWDYSVAFFGECAANLAHVPAARLRLGSYCMQNAMLSGIAEQFRENGASKEQAYQGMPIKGDTPNSLVDKVYAEKRTRAVAIMDGWNGCVVGAPPI
jgi:hypothetical protein